MHWAKSVSRVRFGFSKKLFENLVYGISVVAFAGVLQCASSTAASAQQVPELPYDVDSNVIKIPKGLYMGEQPGVALNSKGHIFIYPRAGEGGSQPLYHYRAARLFEFDADGTFIREIGQNLISMGWAHSVRIDKYDNIWIVDNGTNMITKFNPAGEVMMVLGRRQESMQDELPANAPPRQYFFNEPTGVAWDSKDNIYVSDGYKNSRVAKFDKNGAWIKAWGEPGNGPGQFKLPHGIAIDAKDNVYVADRGNNRIQVFDADGKFLRQITENVPEAPGTIPSKMYQYNKPGGGYDSLFPMDVCVTPGPTQYLYAVDHTPGRIFKFTLDGKLLGVFGRPGLEPGKLAHVHGITCPSENVVYTAERAGWRIQKFTLKK